MPAPGPVRPEYHDPHGEKRGAEKGLRHQLAPTHCSKKREQMLRLNNSRHVDGINWTPESIPVWGTS